MRKLLTTILLSGFLLASGAFTEARKGGWVFDASPDFPGFTRIMIEDKPGKLSGKLISHWYGDLPLTELHKDGDDLVFKLCNGKPRVTMTDIHTPYRNTGRYC